jgi:hypothetical protein
MAVCCVYDSSLLCQHASMLQVPTGRGYTGNPTQTRNNASADSLITLLLLLCYCCSATAASGTAALLLLLLLPADKYRAHECPLEG